MKRVTIGDVAERASVSKSTVSQYLNGRFEYMSEATKLKVEKAIEELQYRPNTLARSLKQKSTKTIGVIVANIVHSFSTQIINELEMSLHKHGFHMIMCNSNDQPEMEREHIEVLLAKQVDGMLIFPTGGNVDLYEILCKQQFPIVFIDRKIDQLPIPSVLLDNKLASSLAVDAFVKRGYQRIAFVTNSIDLPITPRIERLEGYKEAMATYGINVTDRQYKAVPIESVQEALDELFNDFKPEAVLAANDRILLEILSFVSRKGLKIPADIGVIVIDEVPFASFFTPPISTIEQPSKQIVLQATKSLIEQIQNQANNQQQIHRFKPVLHDRNSY